jgi:hypothetical protein
MKRILLVTVLAAAALGYSPELTPEGRRLRRADVTGIKFQVNGNGAPADARAALQAAADAWSAVPTSTVKFLPIEATTAGADPSDGRNTIVFADTPENRSVTGAALAVTALIFYDDGEIFESDIIFNPAARFSTNLALDTFDLQSVATHELGHALGANHSGLLAATMFQGTGPQSNMQNRLSADDMAFATDSYPSAAAAAAYASLTGKVSFTTGEPVRGALLVAFDPAAGVTVGGLSSLSDGRYSFKAPVGKYTLYAEPLDGPVAPPNLYLSNEQVDRAFRTTFSPQPVDLTTAPVAADIAVAAGSAPFDVQFVGTGVEGGSGDALFGQGAAAITAGQPVDLVLFGTGLDSVSASYEVRVLGTGITVRPNSTRIDPLILLDGARPLRVTLDVAIDAGRIASVVVLKDSVAVAVSGGLLVVTPPAS